MSYYQITGGHPLTGSVQISGAKNAASKLILASLLTNEPCEFSNVPQIGEIDIALELFRATGAKATQSGDGVKLDAGNITNSTISELSRKNRLPILAVGPLLHRTGKAVLPRLGGDKIGSRPVNFHLDALRAFGADVTCNPSTYEATAKELHGAKISLPFPSVGATETVLLTAVLAKGKTVLQNAAIEPEILDVVAFLKAMGANISLTSERTFEIVGVEKLGNATHTVLPDRLEAASFAAAALATKGDVTLSNVRPADLTAFLRFIEEVGGKYEQNGTSLRVWYEKPLVATSITTGVCPEFATDWQQPSVVVLTQANGVSSVHETVYSDRLGYTADLKRMGADIQTSFTCIDKPCQFEDTGSYHSAIITGSTPLHGADITIPDIRAGMAHVIGALVAHGESKLSQIDILDRGYEKLEEKLSALGAQIERK